LALLTPEQLEQLRRAIQDASTAVAISTVGHTVTDDELQRLVDEGWVDPDKVDDVVMTGFQYGNLLSHLPRAADMGLGAFIKEIQRNPIKLSAAERQAVQIARDRAGQYCAGLGSRYNEEMGRMVVEADAQLAKVTRELIADETAKNIATRGTRKQLGQTLGKLTRDWARDWRRIANTEIHMAQQEGYLEDVRERYGDDELLAKIPEPNACKHCKRLYLDGDGQPIVRPASWWAAQGASNAGRKAADWLPVLGAMHPWCQCRMIRVPAGWKLDGEFPDWDLVPEGLETEKSRVADTATRDQLEKAKKPTQMGFAWEPAPKSRKGAERRRLPGGGYEYRYQTPVRAETRRKVHGAEDLAAVTSIFVNVSGGSERKRFVPQEEGEGVDIASKNVHAQITAHEVPKTDKGRSRFAKLAKERGMRLMIDSGEFGRFGKELREYKKAEKEEREPVVPELDFNKVFDNYEAMAKLFPAGKLTVVAPDRIANPDKTAELRKQYAGRVKALQAGGAEVIVPIQARSAEEIGKDYIAATKVFGEDVTLGFPTAAAVLPMEEILPAMAQLYAHGKFPRIHFLGGGRPREMAERTAQLVAAAYFAGQGVAPERVLELTKTADLAARALRNVKTADMVLGREADEALSARFEAWAEEQGLDTSDPDFDETEAWPDFYEAHPEEFNLELDSEDKPKLFRKMAADLVQMDSRVVGSAQQYGLQHDPITGTQIKAGKKITALPKAERHPATLQAYLEAREHQTERFTPPAMSAWEALWGDFEKVEKVEKSRKLHGRRKFQGFDISIENRVGSVRHWYDKATDTKGETKMVNPYGYIRLTEGTDGDHVDVFLGEDEQAPRVYVIHQMKAPSFTEYDEDKCMLGFPSARAAKAAYLRHFDSPKFFGSMTALPVEEFRKKVYKMKGELIKAGGTYSGYASGSQPRSTSIVGTMGQHDRKAPRTAGANVRENRADHTEDWPPYQERRIRKVRKVVSAEGAADPVLAGVSLTQLVAAAERFNVRGLQQSHDWANKPKLDRCPDLNEAVARTDAGKKNLETVEEIGRQRRKTAAGARLTLNPKLIRREQKR